MKNIMRHMLIPLGLITLMSACSKPEEEKLWMLNKQLSDKFTYISDPEKWGVLEKWEWDITGDKPFSGDCEEYAIAMKKILDSKGIPSSIYFVLDGKTGHAVTCTETDWCLDYNDIPTKLKDTGYVVLRKIDNLPN